MVWKQDLGWGWESRVDDNEANAEIREVSILVFVLEERASWYLSQDAGRQTNQGDVQEEKRCTETKGRADRYTREVTKVYDIVFRF